jgi:hypothetical protein
VFWAPDTAGSIAMRTSMVAEEGWLVATEGKNCWIAKGGKFTEVTHCESSVEGSFSCASSIMMDSLRRAARMGGTMLGQMTFRVCCCSWPPTLLPSRQSSSPDQARCRTRLCAPRGGQHVLQHAPPTHQLEQGGEAATLMRTRHIGSGTPR